jgi:hypothetical protein
MKNLKTLFPLFLVLGVLLSCGLGDKAKQVTQLAKSVEQAQKNLASGDTSGAFGVSLWWRRGGAAGRFQEAYGLVAGEPPGI